MTEKLPNILNLKIKKLFPLRYGENPHQKGAFYVDPKNKNGLSIQNFRKIQGKDITFNNILDVNAAIDCLSEIEEGKPACVVIKHANPCGAAYGKDAKEAFMKAWYEGDSLAAFGGIICINREIDKNLAKIMLKNFFEVLATPGIRKDAQEVFSKKPKLLILTNSNLKKPKLAKEFDFKKVRGGFLVQEPDLKQITEKDLEVMSKIKPNSKEIKDLIFAWKICKVSKSNAVVLVKDETLIASGVGQQDRKRACKLAIEKAGKRARGAVAASDGFFPFADGPEILIKAGVKAIIQPGGSIRDKETIELCDKYKIPMVFTDVRCFRH